MGTIPALAGRVLWLVAFLVFKQSRKEAAEANGRSADLAAELVALFNAQNDSPDPAVTSIPATFLRVTVAL